jgi:uncharacterized protein (DUF433 family)
MWCPAIVRPLKSLPSTRNGRYDLAMDWRQYISIDPEIRSGKPCVVGTRIAVFDVLDYLAGGMTETPILSDFPSLRVEHIRACLAFAAERERRLSSPRAA